MILPDGLVKSFIGICSGAGGVGIATPIAYVAASQPSHQTFWRKTLNNTGPVISCDSSGDKYEVVLSKVEGDERDLGLGITLKVWITWKSSGNKTERKWGRKVVGRDDWFDFGLDVKGKRLEAIMYRENKTNHFNWQQQVTGCGGEMLQVNGDLSPESGTGGVTDVFKFEENKCKSWFLTAICNNSKNSKFFVFK